MLKLPCSTTNRIEALRLDPQHAGSWRNRGAARWIGTMRWKDSGLMCVGVILIMVISIVGCNINIYGE